MELPLVRARYAHSFAVALDKLGVPTDTLLSRHRLPAELVTNPDGIIAAHQLWSFAGEAAAREGIPELGLLAGQVPVVEHGQFGKMVYHAITLQDAIQTFCHNATVEYSRADFYLTRDEHQAWFCRGPIEGTPAQVQQVELYVVMMMIDTIRLGAGRNWHPGRVFFQNSDARGLADLPMLRHAELRFGCGTTAIGVPITLLCEPLSGDITAFTRPENLPDDISAGTEFGNSLRRLLAGYMGHEQLTLDTTSEIVGIAPRTLQRRLAQCGTSFKLILDELRYEAALPMLKDRGQKIIDIAFTLGYADGAHFTRAFRRWAGVTPAEYRRQEKRAQNT